MKQSVAGVLKKLSLRHGTVFKNRLEQCIRELERSRRFNMPEMTSDSHGLDYVTH